jgi:hypothetical protein
VILFLSSGWRPIEREHLHEPHLGRLVHPLCCDSVEQTAASGMPYAADNDAFSGFDAARFTRMLDRLEPLHPGPMFVNVPDVVADAAATLRRWHEWLPELQARGLPASYVLQDGQENVPVPWNDCAAVFVGGSTEFKLGPVAAELVAEAKRRGLWVHVGRVNTRKRASYIASIGADSFDGTSFSRFRHTHLPNGLAWAAAPVQPTLA